MACDNGTIPKPTRPRDYCIGGCGRSTLDHFQRMTIDDGRERYMCCESCWPERESYWREAGADIGRWSIPDW